MAAVLIVEDRPIDRKFLATLLKTAGHTVVEAGDGIEALRLAEASPPDLVISDILMPTVDGYELVRRMREITPLASTPVIFYTATYHEREARALATQCGVADILTKPSEPKAILAKVDAVIASRRTPPPAPQDPSDFARDHLRVVSSTLASKVEDFQASEQRMAAIVGIAQQITAERDHRALLHKVCEAAREVTLAQHAVIILLTEDRSAFQRVSASGIEEATLVRMDVPSVESAAFKDVITTRRPVRLRNPGGRPEAIGLPATHPPTRSSLAVPIASPARVYGCLRLGNKLGADSFSDRDEEVALTLATHAGIAYENARLADDLRRHSTALEREVAERRRAEARTQVALAAARMGIWEYEFASDRVTWSDSLTTISGLSPGQAPTTSEAFFAVIHPDDREAFKAAFQRAVRSSTDLVNEFRMNSPDGQVRWIAGRARVVPDASGTAASMIGVGIDVSQLKLLEEQFRQAQKMEAVGQLAGGMAHDFNNLLTAIHGYATLVLSSLSQNDGRRADVEEITKAADRAARLTRQLLAFSRKQILQPTILNLNQLIADTATMLRRLIGEDIELVTGLAEDLAPVRADVGQLEQIVMNLAVNARDAMPQGGRLSIETANVQLDETYAMQHVSVRPGRYVMLAVTDNGIGMDEQTKQRIFEPFFTTKEKGRGTGLGLATVYGIVKQSGGYVWVYGEPGHGTTFKIYLPRAVEAATVPRPVLTRKTSPTGSETILLVEDERSVRRLARKILERAGYAVVDAESPRQAEEVFQREAGRIHLLVTDLIMPGSSGPAMFARLSRERPDLKVLYISGYTDDAFVHQAGLPADVPFLQKPFTADGLLCKVREVIDR